MTQRAEANRNYIENEHLLIKTLFELTLMKISLRMEGR